MKFNKILTERNIQNIQQTWDYLHNIFNAWKSNPANLKRQLEAWFGNLEGSKSIDDIDELIKNVKQDIKSKGRKWDNNDEWLSQYLLSLKNNQEISRSGKGAR